MANLFSLENAEVTYPGGVKALDGLSLRMARGERLCVIGPSGSGKTTFMGLLNARVRATGGRVEVLGRDLRRIGVKDLRALRSEISWVPQDLGLVLNLRVLQNVLTGGGGRCGGLPFLRRVFFPKMAEAEEVHALLRRVGIAEKLYARTAHLSGGQKQRVAIARALYQNPQAILADEPVSAVDPARARRLVTLLGEVAAEENLALVMSLHDVGLAREFFPRLVGLRAGRVFFDKNAAEVTDGDLEKLYRAEDGGD